MEAYFGRTLRKSSSRWDPQLRERIAGSTPELRFRERRRSHLITFTSEAMLRIVLLIVVALMIIMVLVNGRSHLKVDYDEFAVTRRSFSAARARRSPRPCCPGPGGPAAAAATPCAWSFFTDVHAHRSSGDALAVAEPPQPSTRAAGPRRRRRRTSSLTGSSPAPRPWPQLGRLHEQSTAPFVRRFTAPRQPRPRRGYTPRTGARRLRTRGPPSGRDSVSIRPGAGLTPAATTSLLDPFEMVDDELKYRGWIGVEQLA